MPKAKNTFEIVHKDPSGRIEDVEPAINQIVEAARQRGVRILLDVGDEEPTDITIPHISAEHQTELFAELVGQVKRARERFLTKAA